MIPSGWQSKRRLVPRWRSLKATLASRELASPPPGEKRLIGSPPDGSDLLSRLERWQLAPSLVSAAELVEAAIVDGREERAVAAARRLINVDKTAAPLIRAQAASLLIRTGHREDVPPDLITRDAAGPSARFWTRLHPRDPLAWVELALHQTIHNHEAAAERSMAIALGLAPSNRHVIRSAARLFLHMGDPERAHDLVVRNGATSRDPWLIAAEIAFAELAERRPKFMKPGLRMLEAQGLAPRQLTELAGSIATEEMVHGNRRKARKSFAQSMIDPTGSALAQGEWASPLMGEDFVSYQKLQSTPEASEAYAFHLFRNLQFDAISDACLGWATADPFSIRPFEFGAASASVIQDYEHAKQLALRGLELRPRAPTLLNAAAFALASSGKADEALTILNEMAPARDEYIKNLTLANRGLIAFRLGDTPGGKQFYQAAIDGFAKQKRPDLSAKARVYLAREAVLAESEDASELVEQARKATDPVKDSILHFTFSQVEALFREKAGLPPLKKRELVRRPQERRRETAIMRLPSGEEKRFMVWTSG